MGVRIVVNKKKNVESTLFTQATTKENIPKLEPNHFVS